jgi:hypothetical protein
VSLDALQNMEKSQGWWEVPSAGYNRPRQVRRIPPLLEGQGSDAVSQRAIFSPVRIESIFIVVVLIMDSDSMFAILLANILTWSRDPAKIGVALRLASLWAFDPLDNILLQLVERSILLPGKPPPP